MTHELVGPKAATRISGVRAATSATTSTRIQPLAPITQIYAPGARPLKEPPAGKQRGERPAVPWFAIVGGVFSCPRVGSPVAGATNGIEEIRGPDGDFILLFSRNEMGVVQCIVHNPSVKSCQLGDVLGSEATLGYE